MEPNEPDKPDVAELVASAATAATHDRGRLVALVTHCWPGGGDTSEPAALAWLRRWRPDASFVAAADCACDAGRCAWCN